MRILGLDGGIASIGWAVIETDDIEADILAAGARTFDAPETDKERTPTNQLRQLHRGQRRVIRRRRQRMAALRGIMAEHGLLADAGRDGLKHPGLDPWVLRAEGLQRVLAPVELAVAIGHIARHRGFRSNSKRDRGANAANDTSAMLNAIDAMKDRLAGRTVGEMFASDPAFVERKRNRGGDFSRSVLRDDLAREVKVLFAQQRRLGSSLANEDLEDAFSRKAFSQLPLQDSEHLVGMCPFEPGERRAARRSHGFEMFRLLSRLANLRLAPQTGGPLSLNDEQIRLIAADFGKQKKISYRTVRKLLDLDARTRFADVTTEDEARDVVARSGNAAEGSGGLRAVVGEAGWRALLANPERLDRIATVLTFRDDLDSIRKGITETGLEKLLVEAILQGVTDGRFNAFKGTGHISAKAARILLPHLARGMVYSEACAAVGYDHAAQTETSLEDIKNPTARKALGEYLKQVRVLVRTFGLPEKIHVELARDVGKSAAERDEITRGIEKRNKERDKNQARFAELLGREPTGVDEMLRFELWQEQNGRCLYSDELISPNALMASDSSVQVDHILPWSRFGDDSFINKTLCTARANQMKRGRTPYEWFQAERSAEEWTAYRARVDGCKAMKGTKKRGFYLRQNATEVEERFKARNLGDTRYATRALMEMLKRLYPQDGQVHVLARPGSLTSKLRRAWGLEDIKKGADGKRVADDRHHALDAIVLAATSERMAQVLTANAQEAERQGLARNFIGDVPEPWPGFRERTREVVSNVFVSRAERRRVSGKTHDATIKQVKQRDGVDVVFARKAVEALTLADLDKVKDPERNAAVVAALRAWIEAGKPKGAPPRSPKGDMIRKVRLETEDKVAVAVRGGTADRGDMARVDVFRKANAKGRARFYLVPVYPHQIADRKTFPAPPDRAVAAAKPESDWKKMDASFAFMFSLYMHSLVEVVKPDGEIIEGYFKGLDRSGGGIALATPKSLLDRPVRIGTRTLLAIRKKAVDRLGRVSDIEREARTWHGVVCT